MNHPKTQVTDGQPDLQDIPVKEGGSVNRKFSLFCVFLNLYYVIMLWLHFFL